MRYLRLSILCLTLFAIDHMTTSASALEVLASWSGTSVDSFDAGYQVPTADLTPGVNGPNSGGKVGANVTISAGILNQRLLTFALGGYLQFKVQADSGYDVTIDNFQVTTDLANVGLATSIDYSTTEGSGYSQRGSLVSLALGTNTYNFSSAVTVPAGQTAFFRFNTAVAGVVTYDVTQSAVFSFNGSAIAVPEPSTFAMAAAGIAVLGSIGGRRRKRASRLSAV